MSETENPAEVLRAAAVLMRSRAEAASSGPWKRFGMAGVAGADWEVVDERRVECDCGEPVALLGCATNADADHIASWHPAVALAVADWLDMCADTYELHSLAFMKQALTVARTYLGRP